MALLLIVWLGGCASPTGAIVVEPIAYQTGDGPVRGQLARIDLRDPSVEVVVTRVGITDADAPARAEAVLETTPDWAERLGLALAVNANYFGVVGRAADRGVVYADVIGLWISGGEPGSPRRVYAGEPGPALVIGRDRRARVTTRPHDPTVTHAVAGVGPSASEPGLGGLLVTAGRNTGATCRVSPTARHPRTAAGTDRAGATLWLAVIDGRQPGHSVGATLPELAQLLIDAGVHDAVNLDGGGSSSFVYRPADAHTGDASRTITNRPSDGAHRPVAIHLGVRLSAPARQDRQDR
ncbi:MAG: phosphodiester glycosidase family protein [Phycisphaeraceae bacterium]